MIYWPGTTIRPKKRLVISSLTFSVGFGIAEAFAAALIALRLGSRYSKAWERMMFRSCARSAELLPVRRGLTHIVSTFEIPNEHSGVARVDVQLFTEQRLEVVYGCCNFHSAAPYDDYPEKISRGG